MVLGKSSAKHSPIVRAIALVESVTTGEIRVHISKHWIEKDPHRRARRLFHIFGMEKTTHRNAVLLYINLRRKKFAIVGDEGIHQKVGQKYWEELAQALAQDLRGTHSENAIALAVRTIGFTLQHYFPLAKGKPHPNELPNEVTED